MRENTKVGITSCRITEMRSFVRSIYRTTMFHCGWKSLCDSSQVFPEKISESVLPRGMIGKVLAQTHAF